MIRLTLEELEAEQKRRELSMFSDDTLQKLINIKRLEKLELETIRIIGKIYE